MAAVTDAETIGATAVALTSAALGFPPAVPAPLGGPSFDRL
jgi:hypothetical protein